MVKFEEPFSNGTYGGAADHSHSFMLRWDHSWLYIAVVVYDDIFELTHEINGCYEAGIQLAIEVGGPEARNLDGESVLGLLQAQRSRDVGLSRLVLLNIGPAAQSLFCSCEDCPNVEFSPSQACCVGYENHGVASPLGEGFEYKIKTAIRRDQDSKETIYEVAIHRDDLMYPDWKGRHPSALSRWLSGTTFGFSLSVTEGEEKPGDDPPVQHSWGGYYPHVRAHNMNPGRGKRALLNVGVSIFPLSLSSMDSEKQWTLLPIHP